MSGVVLSCGGRFIWVGEPLLRIEKPWETVLCKRIPLDNGKAGIHTGWWTLKSLARRKFEGRKEKVWSKIILEKVKLGGI
jgi:hypothetical protein